ncbi:hypothetical protein V8J88_08365 [Massilia sp. W12]|uniref:hypothetical protein n=1 Tax=Massilia sp. W12 TaxID=3126507 RepID=UPI0030D1CBA8
MPIIDIEWIAASADAAPPANAQALADALGTLLGSAPGHTWLRLRALPADCYAENEVNLTPAQWPVFVTVLLRVWPDEATRAKQAQAISACVAAGMGCDETRVHVEYAPPAGGRLAFGGVLTPGGSAVFQAG